MNSDITLAVPAYFHPRSHPADWARLAALGPSAGAERGFGRESGSPQSGSPQSSSPGGSAAWPGPVPDLPLGFAVMNPDSGPGTEPDPAYHPVISAVASTGGRVVGYVDTAYARRPSGAILRELAAYRAWYGLTGVFFDQASSGAHHLAHYRRLVAGARRIGFELVVLNPGVTPSPGFADLADVLVTFEGELNAYGDYLVAEWMRGYPRERFCHLIHSGGPTALADARARAAANHVGVLYATELTGSNPWAALCSELLPGVLSPPG